MTDQIKTTNSQFSPDWVSPPGDTILDLIEEREWTQAELADRLGYSTKHVSLLINGKVPLSEDAAVRLQTVLGASVGFWLKREAIYRERVAILEAKARHEAMIPWLEKIPVKDLMSIGALPKRRVDKQSKPGIVAELLAFFGVATPEQWQGHYACMELAFRRNRVEQSDIGAISAWLRLGERIAEKMDGPKYSSEKFREVLPQIRMLTALTPEEFAPRLTKLFHEAGVVFVVVPSIPRACVSGVARWLNPNRPLIQVSDYGKSNDRFWFTVFHEVAHILLHSKEKKTVFLEDPDAEGPGSLEEREADAWARNFLVSDETASELPRLKTKSAVCDFAQKLQVHPGVIVGRLQHDSLIEKTWMNELKIRVEQKHFSNSQW